MKLPVLLFCLVALAWVLWLAGMLSDDVALLTMGVGVGLLFVLSERGTR